MWNFGMSLCGFFGEILINWNNEAIDKYGFFPYKVAKNIMPYFNKCLDAFSTCAVLDLLLIYKLKKVEEIKAQASEGLLMQNNEGLDNLLINNEEKDLDKANNHNTIPMSQEKEKVINIEYNDK